MHFLSVDHFQSSKYGGLLTHPPNFDDWKWSTDKMCIRNEVTSQKIHTLAVKVGTLAMKNLLCSGENLGLCRL